ncbi:MAG: ribosomal protection-like ABC-F family protein [Velocimicrobium sp.]
MLLTGQNILKEYGIQRVLDIDKIEIKENDRIGLIGRNGAGKSTLLKILSGRGDCDFGVINRRCEIAEIMQNGETDGCCDGKHMSQMGLKNSAIMSGGEKTRLSIAAAFSKHAPLLFADEPTTNLDLDGIVVLEKLLSGYRGAVVLISHDRELINHVCNQIWELEEGALRIYPGNYDAWHIQKKKEKEFQQFEYEQYQKEKKRLESNITKVEKKAKKMSKPPKRMSSSEWMLYKGTASIQQGHVSNRVTAFESRLQHLDKKEKPIALPSVSMKLGDYKKIKAKVAARVLGLSVCFDEKEILHEVNISIQSAKKTFLVGGNGSGKTTLIKHLIQNGEHTYITEDANIGYFSQEQETLDFEKTVLENVLDSAVVPTHCCRAVLMNLYMNENDLSKKISALSGGERVKTAIAKLLVSGANFLIFDEPTNHMDVYTMDGFEKLVRDYDGTVFIISHDRKLVKNLSDHIYEIKDCKILCYSDNF